MDGIISNTTLHARLATVRQRLDTAIRNAGRDAATVRLVAISKWHSAQAIAILAAGGQQDFGENYVQEALAKRAELAHNAPSAAICWHFTGHVQSRKARDVAGQFALIHTVDSLKIAEALEKHMATHSTPGRQAVLIQVNVGEEAQKFGVAVKDLPALAEKMMLLPHVELQGLMCLPPVFDAGMAARPYFALLRRLQEDLRPRLGLPLPHLSMGMSGDCEAAVLEGATLVRIGTDIFGQRRVV